MSLTLPDPFAPLLKTQQVAALLAMSREQVWRLWSSGKLPGYKLDRHLRFAPEDVHAFLRTSYNGSRVVVAPDAARRRGVALSSDYEPL